MSSYQNNTPPHDPEPIREDWTYTQRLDSTGRPSDELDEARVVEVSPLGAISQKLWRKERHYHCGHGGEQPMGGRCGEPDCFNVSCANCFQRCSRCQVPLCLFHVRFLEGENAAKLAICSQCQDRLHRKRFWQRVWSITLSPFINFDQQPR